MVTSFEGGILLLKGPWLSVEEHRDSLGGIVVQAGMELHDAEECEGTLKSLGGPSSRGRAQSKSHYLCRNFCLT